MEPVILKSKLGINVYYPNVVMKVIETHNIPCGCEYGLIKNWFGWSKICPVCKGSYSLGTYETTRYIR